MRHQHPNFDPARSRRSERGAGLVEYSLLLALIAIVVFGAVSFFGESNRSGFGRSAECIRVAYEGTLGTECPDTP